MTDSTAPQGVRNYLAQLERALVGLSAGVRDEIMAGIREELDGLDAAAAASRIEALGEPEFIADQARIEAAPSAGPVLVGSGETAHADPRWYLVFAALLFAVGAIVIPVVGWIVGVVMVCLSRTWTRGEKWMATLTPFVAVAVAVLIVTATSLWGTESSGPSPTDAGSGFHAPSSSDFANPLVPAIFDVVWSGIVLFCLANVVAGSWLLWRARSRW